MATKLVIVESPTKAHKIGDYLGKGYTVMASVGHIRDLAQPSQVPAADKAKFGKFGVDVNDGFKPYYIVDGDKKRTVSELKSALKNADELYLATDEDREGEAIAWHLVQTLKPEVPVKRMVFHEITKNAINASLNNTRDVDGNMVDAQETRRILDRLYGYELSPVLWRKVGPGLSAGRVQSVATRLIVERERERMAFKRAPYWDIVATLSAPDALGERAEFSARMIALGGKRLAGSKDFGADGQLTPDGFAANVRQLDEAGATAVASALKTADFTVMSMETKPYRRRPQPPFTTSTLQQTAGNRLGMGARAVMRAAQSLYENGYITYMRTDSVTLSQEGITAARNADEAHEGLQQQVAQLGEIDARAINTIDIGDGLHVRVGRYGPYLEDMEHLDAEGNPKRASLPDTIAPDELTVAVARDLIDNHSGGPRELGVDPVSGGTVEVRNGRFGPYVALVPPAEASAGAAGDTAGASAAKKGSKKAAAAAASRPKMASLFKTMSPESLSLEDALKLLSLPREVGTYEETNAETGEVSECTVAANNGRYGPYLTKTGADGKSETRSLASEDEIFTVDIDKAKELFSQPKYGRGRGRGAAKPPLRDLGKDPNTGKNVTIKDGRFGAYITDGETNRTVPRQYTPESITPDDAFRLLAEKRAAGPSTRGRRGAGRAGGAKAVAGKGKKGGTSAAVSAQEAKRAERRAEVKKLANKGWSNQRIAEKLGSTPATVKKDVDWLTANEGYERPAVIPKRG